MEPDVPQRDFIGTCVNARQYSFATLPTGKNSPRVSKASLIFFTSKIA
jgi:hypothetical protein